MIKENLEGIRFQLVILVVAVALIVANTASAKSTNSHLPLKKHAKLMTKALPQKRAPASLVSSFGAVAGGDPAKALEIRGQARTLSMMLVLKNGKDDINFIKVRKDYSAEIRDTEF